MPMYPDIKAQWVNALRSDQYVQGTGYLHNPDTGEHCCLGVLCRLAEEAGVVTTKLAINPSDGAEVTRFVGASHQDGSTERLPKAVQDWAGLPNHDPSLTWADEYGEERTDRITDMNDLNDFEFADLAYLIEEQL